MLEKLKNRMQDLERKAKELGDIAEMEFEKIKLTEDKRNDRMAVCKQCEHLFAPTSTCKLCGCFMTIKTYLPSAECPKGIWPIINIVEK